MRLLGLSANHRRGGTVHDELAGDAGRGGSNHRHTPGKPRRQSGIITALDLPSRIVTKLDCGIKHLLEVVEA
jgi:hypothetical protein